MILPVLEPMRLARRRDPFSHKEWLYEIKHDGFRALAYVYSDRCVLVSRNGNTFTRFGDLADSIYSSVKNKPLILDGEIVCLDAHGRSAFNDLLFHRGVAHFYAFDLPWCTGEDVRTLPLSDRKQRLRGVVASPSERLHYCDHVHENGERLFELACEHDLEGIVAKWHFGPYVSGNGETSWVKVRNRNYTQIMGRDELFAPERKHRPERASDGWGGCTVACAERALYGEDIAPA